MSTQDQDAEIAIGVGQKLRLRRKVRGLSLKDVADRSGLSIGLVSQIERGLSTPSLRALNQICGALDMPIRWLFDGSAEDSEEDGVVVRARNRRQLDFGSRGMAKDLMSPDTVPEIQMMRITIQPGGSSGDSPYNNPGGAKCGTVTKGLFGLMVDGREYVLGPGDSFAFHATSQHRFWCAGDEPCQVIWVVTPAVY
jgi:transcriptional regulator with XRE-family HTH domain